MHNQIQSGVLPCLHASINGRPDPSSPAAENPGIARCVKAYGDALDGALRHSMSKYDAEKFAQWSWRDSLPPLAGEDNIRDFVACIGQGMLLKIIDSQEGTRLLYAAQVAFQACHKPGKTPTRGPGRPRSADSPDTTYSAPTEK